MNMSRILSQIMLGRLLLLVIITAPPAACTRASEEIAPAALQTVERGPVTLSVIAGSETACVDVNVPDFPQKSPFG